MPTVNCPQCQLASVWSAANPYRPFCSERCKLIDFGAWANGDYAIPVEAPPEPGEDAELN
jgi:uncharacterized protein